MNKNLVKVNGLVVNNLGQLIVKNLTNYKDRSQMHRHIQMPSHGLYFALDSTLRSDKPGLEDQVVDLKKKSRKLRKKRLRLRVVKGRRKTKERSQHRSNLKKKRMRWIFSGMTMRKIR